MYVVNRLGQKKRDFKGPGKPGAVVEPDMTPRFYLDHPDWPQSVRYRTLRSGLNHHTFLFNSAALDVSMEKDFD